MPSTSAWCGMISRASAANLGRVVMRADDMQIIEMAHERRVPRTAGAAGEFGSGAPIPVFAMQCVKLLECAAC